MDALPLIPWRAPDLTQTVRLYEGLPQPEVTELPPAEGLFQFELARRLQDADAATRAFLPTAPMHWGGA